MMRLMRRTIPSSTGTVIIGGGVIGLALANELLVRGESVVVLDRGELGRGTSWAAAGILPPASFQHATDANDQLRGFSHALYPSWCHELHTLTGIDPGFRQCGGYHVAETAGEAATLIGMASYWRDWGITMESLSGEEFQTRMPEFERVAAWFTPDECHVQPPRLLAALRRAAELRGGVLVEHADVTAMDHQHGLDVQFTVGDALDAQTLRGRRLVLCGGAMLGHIDPQFQMQEAIIPIRGQILLLRVDAPRHQSRLAHEPSIVNCGNRYFVGRGDGHVLVGSCEEEAGFVIQTTPEMIDSLHAFAMSVCPIFKDARVVNQWSGLRPMTFGGFPMIGKLPGHDYVYVAGGHYRSGIHNACGTARLLSDLMDGKDSFMNAEPFAVRRN